MNPDDPRLDLRMRRMLADLDASTGFESRVMQRIAALAANAGVRTADLRAQFERRRELVRRRLRREAWSNAISIAGTGVAVGALVWRYSAEIMQWATAPDLLVAAAPILIAGAALAAIGAAAWPFLPRMRGLMK